MKENLVRFTCRMRPVTKSKLEHLATLRRCSMAAILDVLFLEMPIEQIEKYLRQ